VVASLADSSICGRLRLAYFSVIGAPAGNFSPGVRHEKRTICRSSATFAQAMSGLVAEFSQKLQHDICASQKN
jgi:hypothetical protein